MLRLHPVQPQTGEVEHTLNDREELSPGLLDLPDRRILIR
jgi:hypothetical protein